MRCRKNVVKYIGRKVEVPVNWGRSWAGNGEPAVPGELTELLNSHVGTRRIVILNGITEHETILPFSNRGPRSHDLALFGLQDGGAVTVCVEAKADESFGGTVATEVLKAKNRSVTNFPRLDWLTRSLLGISAFQDDQLLMLSEDVAELPYQLLSAIAGTLLEAKHRNARKAVFVVHEFRTDSTKDAKLATNAFALNDFLRCLLSANKAQLDDFELDCGQIAGLSQSRVDLASTGRRSLMTSNFLSEKSEPKEQD
jgi:hypothetical protein